MTTTEPSECRHCGVEIVEAVDGCWVDLAAGPLSRLVFCTDQDETYDGIRHEPEPEPEPTAAELEADRRIDEDERRAAGEL